MNILIAGLGSIGRRHLRNLIALGEKDIFLLRTHKSTLSDDEIAGYPVETDIHSALAKYSPEAVVVSNPTALHMDVAIPAAEAGCCILLEKPISHSMENLDKLQNAVENYGSRILVGFQFRYHPSLNKAREIIQNGSLGQVLTAHAHWGEYLPNWHPWEDYRQSYAARTDLGGGVIGTLSHPIDYLRFLLGEISALWSFHGHLSPLELEVEDVAEIGLRFSDGAIGGVHVNYVQRPPTHRLEICGTKGTLRWDNDDGILRFYKIPEIFGSYSNKPPSPILETFPLADDFDRNDLFVAQTRHFLNIVNDIEAPICTLDDGIRIQELVEAIHKSQKTGHIVSF